MKQQRSERIKFFTMLRNGIAFCTTWFLILLIIYCYMSGQTAVSLQTLTRMLLLTSGGVLIFSLLFSSLIIRTWSFTKRLTVFMILIGIYQIAAFYRIGLFRGSGSFLRWCIFIVIIYILYLSCLLIYRIYSRKQGEMYTEALRKYQHERSVEHEKQD